MTSEPASRDQATPRARLPFPSAWFYAVIQMDPLAMVRDLGLDDGETLAAVKAIFPKKYLVYVDTALDLPMPNSKWCRYCVTVIGSTLCPEDIKNQILPNMVVPIFPNIQCSSDTRKPIRPLRDFPFDNCFHWIESLTYVRMRRHNTPFVDDSRAIRLDSDQDHAASWTFMQDYERMKTLSSYADSDDSSSIATSSDEEELSAVPSWALLDPVVREACSPFDISQRRRPATPDETAKPRIPGIPHSYSSDTSGASSSSGSEDKGSSKDLKTSNSSVDPEKAEVLVSAAEIFALNIFGWDPDPTFPMFPLVDLWFELDEHLTAETIPSPVEWLKEEKKINSIIKDAFARRKRAMDHSPPTTRSSVAGSCSAKDDPTSPPTADYGEDQHVPPLVQLEASHSNTESLDEPMLGEAKLSSRSRFRSAEIFRMLVGGIGKVFRSTACTLCFRSRDSDDPNPVVSTRVLRSPRL